MLLLYKALQQRKQLHQLVWELVNKISELALEIGISVLVEGIPRFIAAARSYCYDDLMELP